jgi:TetR/AcrR family transcriptional repressor of nem operon
MVQKSRPATSAGGRTGRPLAFQPEAALDAVTRLFWGLGFEGTSLEDLERVSGLSRSSLYNTFGSKRQLFELAVARYLQLLDAALLGPLEQGSEGLADIDVFLDRLGAQLEPGFIAGCLLTNSLAEFGGRDDGVVRDGRAYLLRARGAISAALRRAAARGEFSSRLVSEKADLLVGLVLGINVMARSGVGPEDFRRLIAAAHSEVAGWRRPAAP